MNKSNLRYFEFLSNEEIKEMHHATLSVLESVGVKVLHEKALQMFADAGAKVDFDNQLARIPSFVVEKWIAKAPRSFTLYARDENNDLRFQDAITHYVGAHTTPFVLDLETGQRRPATYADAQRFSKISDSLEFIADGYGMVYPRDVPEHATHAYIVMAQIENSNKVIKARVNGKRIAEDCIRMAEMLAGSREQLKKKPNVYTLVNCVSPLALGTVQIEGLIEYARNGLPCIIASEILSGGTGPITLAGTLVQQNAEVLSHIIIAQMINPGTPVIYGSASTGMDMRTSSIRYGAIEEAMIGAGATQLARYYKIPSRVSAGATDSKMLDMQAGYESANNLLLASLAGPNYISYAAGGVDSAMTTSYEKVVIDHENIGNIKRAMKGITVDQGTLAVEAIKDTGPLGHFLSHKHTFERFREEHVIPELPYTDNYTSWLKTEKKDIRERAKENVTKILEAHNAPFLEKQLRNDLNEFIGTIEQRS